MADEAIHAGSDTIFASYQKLQEKPAIKHEITKRDRLARLADSANWKALCEVIDQRIEELTVLRSMTPSDTVEMVGFRFLASQIAIDYLKEIKAMPARAKKMKKDENS